MVSGNNSMLTSSHDIAWIQYPPLLSSYLFHILPGDEAGTVPYMDSSLLQLLKMIGSCYHGESRVDLLDTSTHIWGRCQHFFIYSTSLFITLLTHSKKLWPKRDGHQQPYTMLGPKWAWHGDLLCYPSLPWKPAIKSLSGVWNKQSTRYLVSLVFSPVS